MIAEEIFLKAIEKKTPAERAAYLDGACGDDGELRAEVDALIASDEKAGSFLEQPLFHESGDTIDHPPISERAGSMIGPYKLLEKIGEGGFGVVFMAEQQNPIVRKVALKIIKPGMDTKDVVARFEAERQALAIMDHPNIARVLDAGTTESGRPFFVMELVKGIPITDYCDEANLSPNERLELFVSICNALQHAHQKGIIHRDVKPSNILVTFHDGEATVKVIDFGVAKALNQRLTNKTLFTSFMQVVGTPLYMSPEQAALSGLDVDTRTDVYSLGVLLYELLTGTTPFDKDRLQKVAYDEIRRIIQEEEVDKPSTRLSTLGEALSVVSARRRMEPGRLTQVVRGDLDWIVMKALDKERRRRYDTASGFAEDIKRYLNDEPITARPPSVAYLARKFVRRHKVTATTLSFVAIVTLAGASISVWQAIRATRSEIAAIQARELAISSMESLADNLLLRENYKEAEDVSGQLVQILQEIAGRENARVLASMMRQAQALAGQGEWKKSVLLLEEIVALTSDRLGGKHSDTIKARDLLASVCKEAPWDICTSSKSSPDDHKLALQLANRRAALGCPIDGLSLGLAQFRNGDIPNSLKSLEAGLHAGQANGDCFVLAMIHHGLGDDEFARAHYIVSCEHLEFLRTNHGSAQLVSQLERLRVEATRLLGIDASFSLRQTVGLQQCVDAYTIALQRAPKVAQFHHRRGVHLAQLDRWEDAKADFHAAAQIESNTSARWLRYAICCLRCGDTEEYEKVAQRIYAQFSKSDNYWVRRDVVATCNFAENPHTSDPELIQIAKEIYSEKPNVYFIRRELGFAEYRTGRYERAIELLHENPDACSKIYEAMAYHKLGEVKKAADCLSTAAGMVLPSLPGQIGTGDYLFKEYTAEQVVLREAQSLVSMPDHTADGTDAAIPSRD